MSGGGSTGKLVASGTGEARWFHGGLSTLLVDGGESGGSLSVIESLGRRGLASPLHRHAAEHEAFYVLEGDITFVCGDEQQTLGAGGFVFLPAGSVHAYVVESDRARFLVWTTSGAFGDFVRAASDPAPERVLPPSPDFDPAVLDREGSLRGIEVLGPPPEPRA